MHACFVRFHLSSSSSSFDLLVTLRDFALFSIHFKFSDDEELANKHNLHFLNWSFYVIILLDWEEKRFLKLLTVKNLSQIFML